MMSNIKTILGRDIDLVTIQQQNPQSEIQRKLPEGVDYVGIKWREIPEHPTDDNLGVRALGTPNAFDTLGFDLKRNGWDITADLPVEDVDDGELNDGRTREGEMRRLGEKWMPVVVAKIAPELKRASAVKLNNHSYSKRMTMDDCVVALVEDIADGYVLPNQDSIETALHTRYNVSELFHEGGGTYTKIVLKVLDRVNNADEVVRNKEGSGWQDWVNANTDYSGVLTINAGGKAPQRFFADHVVPKGRKGEKVQVILYAHETTVQRCKEVFRLFRKNTNKLYSDAFHMVMNTVPGIKIDIPEQGYEIVGIVPQVQNDAQKDAYENGELISWDDYMNQ